MKENELQYKSFMCFDFGLKSIGVAYGSSFTSSARPLGAVRAYSGEIRWGDIDSFVTEWSPEAFVVGLPLHMDGSKQSFNSQLVHFKKQLFQRYEKEVYWADERLTTVAAKKGFLLKVGKKN